MARLREKKGKKSTDQGNAISRLLTGLGRRDDPAEELGPDAGERPIGGGPGQYPNAPAGPRGPNGPPGNRGRRSRRTGGVRSPLG